jgi:tripartite-type tricarboxylate transporter receptor subunit TctC
VSRNPLDVPPDVIERLQQMPEFRRAYEPARMSPAEFVAIIKREAAAYKSIVEKANIKPE